MTPYTDTWGDTVDFSVVSGNTLAEAGFNGGLFLYQRTGGNSWTKAASFFTPPGQDGTYAWNVAIDYAGDRVAVGKHPTRVYTRTNGGWSMTATLPEPRDEAGVSYQNLVMSGDGRTIVTGGQVNVNGGEYYLQTYRLTNAGKWRQLHIWTGNSIPYVDLSLDENGNTLFGENPSGYAVSEGILDPSTGIWRLVTADLTGHNGFGYAGGVSTDASGNRIVVSQRWPPSSTNPQPTDGFIILDHVNGKWVLQGTSVPKADPTQDAPVVAIDAAGDTVNLEDFDTPVPGSPGTYVNDGYIYRQVNGTWTAVGWLKPTTDGFWDWGNQANISADGTLAAFNDVTSAVVYSDNQTTAHASR